MNLLAQNATDLGPPIGEGGGLGPFASIASKEGAIAAITGIVSKVIGIMTIAAGIWFIFQFIVGGYNWLSSGGDKAKLHTARERLTNAFIGLVIVVMGFSMLSLAGKFFGIDFTLSDGLPF